jgi:dTDP-4-dehydrorhamnose 3,5-epimerase-like enzyme
MRFSFKNTSIDDVDEVYARVVGSDNDYLESFGDFRSRIKFDNIFVVSSSADTQRGQHAHLRATQYLFCLAGLIEIEMLDGYNSMKKILKPKDFGLRIPRGIWAVQNFKTDSMLMVISSERYDEKEYVRDFSVFKKKKKTS